MARGIISKIRNALAGSLKSDIYFIIGLILIAVLSHAEWFRLSSVLSAGDFHFHYVEQIRNAYANWGTWISSENFGYPNIQTYFYPFRSLLWSMLALVNLPFFVSVKFSHLIPIAILGFLAPYFLSKHLAKSRTIAFTTALFYGSYTHFLVRQQMHLAIAFVMAITPLILLLFMRALKRNSFKAWAAFTGLFLIGTVYELRMMYIVTGILLIYFLINHLPRWKQYVVPITLAGLLSIGMSAFWLLPTILGSLGEAIESTAGRPLFGNPLYSLRQAFTIFEHSWTGAGPQVFEPQPIPLYLWIIPLIAFLALVLFKRLPHDKRLLLSFFAVLSLIGIAITKQSTAPFPELFVWLREYIPGFVVFRSASKFYFLTAMGFLGLISFSLLMFKKNKVIYYSLISVVLGVSLWNLKPLITKDLGMLTVEKNVPSEYSELKDETLSNKHRERTLWIPDTSRWAYHDSKNGRLSMVKLAQNNWRSLINNPNPTTLSKGSTMMNVLKQSYANSFLDFSGVSKVIVPINDVDNDGDLFSHYEYDREDYTGGLNESTYLRKDEGYKELAVYENSELQPFINVAPSVVSVDGYSDLNNQFVFANNQITNNPMFVSINNKMEDIGSVKNQTHIKSIFKSHDTEELPFVLRDNYISNDSDINIYKNVTDGFVSYEVNDNEIVFYLDRVKEIEVNGNQVQFENRTSRDVLAEVPLRMRNDLLIELDDEIASISDSRSQVLGSTTTFSDMKILTKGDNILEDGSFENSLWQEEVQDCHNYDDMPNIDMRRSTSIHSDGSASLELMSGRHIACTKTTFNVESGEYIFSFDYRSPNTDKAGYFLRVGNDKVVSERLSINTVNDWQTMTKRVIVPENAENVTLYVYAFEPQDPRSSTTSNVYYDNFEWYKPNELVEVDLPPEVPVYKRASLVDVRGSMSFEYLDLDYSGGNVISNGSFENSLWQEEVQDCHNYDDNPDISMRLNREFSVDGSFSLELSTARHTACTFQDVSVGSSGPHLWKFFYRASQDAEFVGYHMSFNDPLRTTIKAKMPVEQKLEWIEFSEKIQVPLGASNATVHLYSYETDGHRDSTILYDDVTLTAIPDLDNIFYLVENDEAQKAQPKNVDFYSVNSTKHNVQVIGAKDEFVLTMAEQFQYGWKVYPAPLNNSGTCSAVDTFSVHDTIVNECLINSKFYDGNEINYLRQNPLFDDQHLEINGFANGWIVDPDYIRDNFSEEYYRENPDGTIDFNLVIYFKPQSYFYLGSVISGTTFVGTLGYLGWAWRKDRHRDKHIFARDIMNADTKELG